MNPEINKLIWLRDFLDRYADYYESPCGDPGNQEHTPDWAMIRECLPTLGRMIYPPPTPDTPVETPCVSDGIFLVSNEIPNRETMAILLETPWMGNIIYTAEKNGREAVNPHWRYCVVSTQFNYLVLTDDSGAAYQEAHNVSLTRSGIFYALKIAEDRDGSWKTYIEVAFDGGEGTWYDKEREYLHFDYIMQAVERTGGTIVKH